MLLEIRTNIEVKLATLWATFMFLYVYVDHFALYMPGKLEGIRNGSVFEFEITQAFLFTALSFAAVPMLMVCLCVTMKAKINRVVNIVVALLHIPYMLFNLLGEFWAHMIFAAVVETVLLLLIIRYAWKWPRVDA